MKNQVIVVPYGDNDFWYVMTVVGNIIASWKHENAWGKTSFEERDDVVSLVHKTMKYVLSVQYDGSEERYFSHLTSSSAWNRFSGSVPNVYIDNEADKYIQNTYPNGNSEILVIDFRLPIGKQVYIY